MSVPYILIADDDLALSQVLPEVLQLPMKEDRTRVLSEGFQIHLAKPFEPAELIEAVANLAGRPQQCVRARPER